MTTDPSMRIQIFRVGNLMDILTRIVENTREILIERKVARPQSLLEEVLRASPRAANHLSKRSQTQQPHVIAEFKRKSPSRPNINLAADPVEVATSYERGGASAMSVLTEQDFFAGSLDDLIRIREAVQLPLLRKDFMVDPYQFYEAAAAGADLILLIARILDPAQLRDYTELAHELGLEVLCEVHNSQELERVGDTAVDFLGVNCRDLKRFETNLDHLVHMTAVLPKHIPWVAESGMKSSADVKRLYEHGYQLFLIGEYLMKEDDPAARLAEIVAL